MRTGAGDSARSDFEAALQRYQQLAPNSLFVALAELNLAKLDYRSGNAPKPASDSSAPFTCSNNSAV